MRKITVLINGNGGTGKDTFVEFCSNFTLLKNISSVDLVKDAASILGWRGGKEENDRKFLADLKFLSSQYNNQPFEYIRRNIDDFRKEESKETIMFIHVREPHEIEKLKNNFNCITLLIKNENVKGIRSNEADANVDNFIYDYVIYNNAGLKELRQMAYDFVMNILYMEEKNE